MNVCNITNSVLVIRIIIPMENIALSAVKSTRHIHYIIFLLILFYYFR